MDFKIQCPQGQEENLFREVIGIIKGLELAAAQGNVNTSTNLKAIMEQIMNQLGPTIPKDKAASIFAEVREQFGMEPFMQSTTQPAQQQPAQQQPVQQQPVQQQPVQQQPVQQQPVQQQPVQKETAVIPLKGSVAMLDGEEGIPPDPNNPGHQQPTPKEPAQEETENSENEREGQS